jgi:hypothetical protein
MDKLIDLIEKKFEDYLKQLEDSPIKTGLKIFIIIWAVKEMVKYLKNEE